MNDGASRETHEEILKETFGPKYRKKKKKTESVAKGAADIKKAKDK